MRLRLSSEQSLSKIKNVEKKKKWKVLETARNEASTVSFPSVYTTAQHFATKKKPVPLAFL